MPPARVDSTARCGWTESGWASRNPPTPTTPAAATPTRPRALRRRRVRDRARCPRVRSAWGSKGTVAGPAARSSRVLRSFITAPGWTSRCGQADRGFEGVAKAVEGLGVLGLDGACGAAEDPRCLRDVEVEEVAEHHDG